MRIAIWQNMPTHLQSAVIRALALAPNVEVVVFLEGGIPEWRISTTGWSTPDYGRARLVDLANEKIPQRLGQFDVHIVGGLRTYIRWRSHVRRMLPPSGVTAIMSEASDWRGMRGLARKAYHTWAARNYGHEIDGVLAIGHLGEEWFRQIGFPEATLFPYGYFVEGPESQHGGAVSGTTPVQIAFVGQLVDRKGVDLLIQALGRLPVSGWQLNIAGAGPRARRLEAQAQTAGIADRVSFRGTMSHSEVRRLLTDTDLLVLPSHWDGWGAVINEGIQAGAQVICTRQCGAADIVWPQYVGDVVSLSAPSSLADALEARIQAGRLDRSQRERIALRGATLAPAAAADYILAVVNAIRENQPKPTPHWLEAQHEGDR